MTGKRRPYAAAFALGLLALSLFAPSAARADCTDPARAEGTVIYNEDQNVPQVCAGGEWIALGVLNPAAGGGSCTDPDRTEGAIVYNVDHKVLQYCDGTDWKALHGGGSGSGGGGTCVPDGLVGHWKLDETSGSIAADSAGTNDGTLVNLDPATVSIPGKLGNALDFSGNTTIIPTADIDYGPGDLVSVAAWVKFTGCTEASNICYIVSKAEFDAQPYNLRVVTDRIRFMVNGSYVAASSAQNDGTWHHAVGTFNGSTCQLYIDGISQGTTACTPVNNDILTAIGGTNVSQNYRNFQGGIDDVRIYNRVLTTQDVSDLYNGGAGCQ